ncbi:hypothetical protein ACFOHT_05215 [Massilia oculi]|uniref:Uncharacterized protein n=1 Tax=Massilia oculi TaxID=945844 RepID=A0A2S2DDN2_9BURK|nr:hypothetical protein [Massilia oculi]AWL03460.1 hypothetical protein DIR46_02645 [Massilia oculi]
MNVLKHMEAIFIAAALVAVPAGYLAKIPDARADNYSIDSAAIASGDKMAVVTVSAKRLDAAEKSQLLAADTVTVGSRM